MPHETNEKTYPPFIDNSHIQFKWDKYHHNSADVTA